MDEVHLKQNLTEQYHHYIFDYYWLYHPDMKDILDKDNLPEDLIRNSQNNLYAQYFKMIYNKKNVCLHSKDGNLHAKIWSFI